jgi:hypothetical protein
MIDPPGQDDRPETWEFLTELSEMRERLADRLAALLREDPEWKARADEIERMLDRSEWGVPTQPRDNPAEYARHLILTNPAGLRLAAQAAKNKANLYGQDDPVELVNQLLPSDHHLG